MTQEGSLSFSYYGGKNIVIHQNITQTKHIVTNHVTLSLHYIYEISVVMAMKYFLFVCLNEIHEIFIVCNQHNPWSHTT